MDRIDPSSVGAPVGAPKRRQSSPRADAQRDRKRESRISRHARIHESLARDARARYETSLRPHRRRHRRSAPGCVPGRSCRQRSAHDRHPPSRQTTRLRQTRACGERNPPRHCRLRRRNPRNPLHHVLGGGGDALHGAHRTRSGSHGAGRHATRRAASRRVVQGRCRRAAVVFLLEISISPGSTGIRPPQPHHASLRMAFPDPHGRERQPCSPGGPGGHESAR